VGSAESLKQDKEEKKGGKAQSNDTAEELTGDTGKDPEKEGLMSSVLQNDKEVIDDGKLLEDSINQGLGAFTPDIMMAQMVQNYRHAKKLYGETILRALSGYDSDYIERNVGVPEFRKELEKKIKQKVEELTKKKLLDKQGNITDKGIELASIVLYASELDIIAPIGVHGERIHKEKHIYGGKGDTHLYKKGDRFKDFNVKRSIKTSLRRGHSELILDDVHVHERQAKGEVTIVYAIDASGSMKGSKIGTCKKAGVALAWKAIQNKDKVGIIVFGEEVIDRVLPTKDFGLLLKTLTKVRAAKETNIAESIEASIALFPRTGTKHLIILTDALPTTGEKPEEVTLQAASKAASAKITISLVGINLDAEGKKLAERIVEIGEGKLYAVSSLDEVDKIVLMDYYSIA